MQSNRIQLAVGDMTMSGWKPTISLIHPPPLNILLILNYKLMQPSFIVVGNHGRASIKLMVIFYLVNEFQ